MSDFPKHDYHMHTKYLGCANATMEIPAIIEECTRIGVTTLGITDHLNSFDKLPLHTPIKNDLLVSNSEIDIYLGVELNFTGYDQDFAYNKETKDELGFQFAIGGIHGTYVDTYNLDKIVEIQHRHHLATCANPLVDVLVHPYWFGKGEFEKNGWPWFDSMLAVPASYARELGKAAMESGTAIEINGCANLENANYSERYVEEYIEYLAIIAAEGALFSTGSDAHDVGRLRTVTAAWEVAKRIGLTAERMWHPKGTALNRQTPSTP
ncbi:MAG: PHP domain-containing protein [Spirochaetales bacterium]|jgi:histidinol phosphatase-like PHP family hydrolase|nr:PHP domain-containing protein [Spirochaetales bacterium]